MIGGALAALVMFDLRDRVRLPELVPMIIAGAIGLVSFVGSVLVSGSATS